MFTCLSPRPDKASHRKSHFTHLSVPSRGSVVHGAGERESSSAGVGETVPLAVLRDITGLKDYKHGSLDIQEWWEWGIHRYGKV